MTGAATVEIDESRAALLLTIQEKIDDAMKHLVLVTTSLPMLKSPPFSEHFHSRKQITQKVPGFWLSVLLSHPAFTFLISSADSHILQHLVDIDLRSAEQPSHADDFDVVFTFEPNSFLSSTTLSKRYMHSDTKGRVVGAASIVWKSSPSAIFPDSSLDSFDITFGFFDWLSNDQTDSSHLGELIRDQIFPHAISLYFGTYTLSSDDSEQTSALNNVH